LAHLVFDFPGTGGQGIDPGFPAGVENLRQALEADGRVNAKVRLPDHRHFPVGIMLGNGFLMIHWYLF
jgi:hypothetical protein